MRTFGYRGWTVLAALSLMMCIAMGLPIYGASVANTYMAVALGWDRQTLGTLTAANMITAAVLSPVAARAVQGIGIRNSLLIGCLFMIVGGLCSATFVTAPWQAIIAFSILQGFTSALAGVIPCQAGVAAWFVRRRTTALSILYAVMGAGSFLVVWLIGAVIESRGNWRSGWWVFVGAGIFGLLLSAAFVRDAPTGEDTGSSELQPLEVHHAVTSNGSELNILQVLRSPLLWAIAFSMLTVMAGSVFMIAHAQVHLRGLGISARAAASTMSILSGAMVVGNLGFGALAPLIELRRAQMLAIAIFCVGLVLLANVQGSATLYSYALIAGIGFGGAQVGSMAMLGHYWGTRVFPALVATGLLVQTAGGGIVPVAAGAYFDTHHSYLPVIYTIVALNVLAVLVLLLTAVPQRQRDAVDESVLLS